jgi:putative heme-binding domain-containing protein
MITRLLLLATLTASAQRGLKDIPDPDTEKQRAAFNLPEGMEINLFASDPVIAKPVQMNFDPQGRLWLVSSGMYPHIVPGAEENDRVLILEDTDGDGHADKRTVFADNLHIPTAVMPADGGAYVANSTELLFLKDTDGDGRADERQVVLSGFGTEDTHHLVHTFEQGPDGMIYFLQSIYIHSHLETPHGVRRLMGGGIWHLRPETGKAEVLSKGLVNPWGFVFDDYGQTFATDGAGGAGINFIFPRSVFVTSPGAERILPGLNPGQPKLLSGSHVPEKLRDVMIAPDFRGHRINAYRLSPNGSTYTSTRIDDFLSSSHRAFRPIDVKMGPDGAVYIADWYNPIIQHGEVDFRDKRRDQTRGRIWRVTFKDRPLVKKHDFSKASIDELLKAITSGERVHRDLARNELRTRNGPELLLKLEAATSGFTQDFDRLQAMWTFQALNETNVELVKALAASQDPRYRAAALRLLYHRQDEVPGSDEIIRKSIDDENAQVRLWAISCLAQKPGPNSVPTALRALDHPIDKPLDFALWSIVREHADHWAPAFESGKSIFGGKLSHLIFAMKAYGKPLSLASIFKNLENNSLTPGQIAEATSVIAQVGSADDLTRLLKRLPEHPEILDQLITAKEIRKIQPKKDLDKIIPYLDGNDLALFKKAARLAGLWKLAPAREKLIAAFSASPEKRQAAAEGIRLFGGKEAITLFEKLISEAPNEEVRIPAIQALASLSPEKAASFATELLAKDTEGKDPHGLFSLFLKSPKSATALAKALVGKALPAKDLMKALQSAGKLKPMSQALSATDMAKLINRVAKDGDPHRGETIYRRVNLQCLACHAIGGVGSPIGPDLVSIGSSAPVDYLITSLLNPNDKIKEGYHTTLVTEKNGNTHTGGLVSESDTEVVLRDYVGQMNRIARADVKTITISPVSMMPPGLTASLREDEFIDLVRFLSELGKEGDFKVSAKPIIRDWMVLQPHARTSDGIGHYGPAIFAEKFEGYQWQPYAGKVNGELLPAELPKVKGRGRSRWGVARFGIDQKGTIKLKINDTHLMHLFSGKKEIKLPKKGPTIVELTGHQDLQHFTLAVNSASRSAPVLLEIIHQ